MIKKDCKCIKRSPDIIFIDNIRDVSCGGLTRNIDKKDTWIYEENTIICSSIKCYTFIGRK